jgi:hypothetical protein
MRRFFTSAIFGVILVTYYVEKHLPFPFKYHRQPDHAGTLEIDLQVVSSIADDLKRLGSPVKKIDSIDSVIHASNQSA